MPGARKRLCRNSVAAGIEHRGGCRSQPESITQTLSGSGAENAVALLPELVERFQVPGVTFRPLRGTTVKWDLQVAWQRGKITEPVRELVNLLTKTG